MVKYLEEELKPKIPTQPIQLPIPLKRELDDIKIIKDESYPSVIRRLLLEHKSVNSKVKK